MWSLGSHWHKRCCQEVRSRRHGPPSGRPAAGNRQSRRQMTARKVVEASVPLALPLYLSLLQRCGGWSAHSAFGVGRPQAIEGALKKGSASGEDRFPCLPTGTLTSSSQRRSKPCLVYPPKPLSPCFTPPTPRSPFFTPPTRPPPTCNTHAHTFCPPRSLCRPHIGHARFLTQPEYHDCQGRCSLCAQTVASCLFTARFSTF